MSLPKLLAANGTGALCSTSSHPEASSDHLRYPSATRPTPASRAIAGLSTLRLCIFRFLLVGLGPTRAPLDLRIRNLPHKALRSHDGKRLSMATE